MQPFAPHVNFTPAQSPRRRRDFIVLTKSVTDCGSGQLVLLKRNLYNRYIQPHNILVTLANAKMDVSLKKYDFFKILCFFKKKNLFFEKSSIFLLQKIFLYNIYLKGELNEHEKELICISILVPSGGCGSCSRNWKCLP